MRERTTIFILGMRPKIRLWKKPPTFPYLLQPAGRPSLFLGLSVFLGLFDKFDKRNNLGFRGFFETHLPLLIGQTAPKIFGGGQCVLPTSQRPGTGQTAALSAAISKVYLLAKLGAAYKLFVILIFFHDRGSFQPSCKHQARGQRRRAWCSGTQITVWGDSLLL